MHNIPLWNKVKLLTINKDRNFYWRHETYLGNIYGVILNRLGMMLLKIARIALRKGSGTFRGKFYQNCSWCGGVQTRETGLHMHSGRYGSRCGINQKQCCKQPYV